MSKTVANTLRIVLCLVLVSSAIDIYATACSDVARASAAKTVYDSKSENKFLLKVLSIDGCTRSILIKNNTSEAVFLLISEDKNLSFNLRSPNGSSITPLSNTLLSPHMEGKTITSYLAVDHPTPGIWVTEIRPCWKEEESKNSSLFVYKYENGADAIFNNHYSDQGIDDDGNGLYDHIDVTVGINVKVPGWFEVSGSLCNYNKNESIFAINKTYLKQGNRSQTLEFYGMHYPGSYYVRNLSLTTVQPPKYTNTSEMGEDLLIGSIESDIGFQDFRAQAYKTKLYDKLDWPINMPWATGMIGAYSDHGIDVNGDGLYEILTVGVGVNIAERGKYTLTGDLYDLNKSEIAWSIDTGNFEPGRRTMHLNFDGKTIQKHKTNGPYLLGNLSLWEGNWSIRDIEPDAYNTSTYNYSDF